MANTQAQFGFQQFGYLPGGAVDYQMSNAVILSTYSTLIGNGDPVMKTNATSPYIIQATGSLATTAPIMGIFVGCMFQPSGGGAPTWSPYWPGAAAANATAYIINAPNALFKVATLQTAVNSTMIGWVANFTTGSPTTTGGGFSVATIDEATATNTGTTASMMPFKIVSLYPGIGNGSDPTTNYNWIIVTFNNQTYKMLSGF